MEHAEDPIAVVPVDPRSDDARRAVAAYADELARRFPAGFDPGPDGGLDRLAPPTGAFVVVRLGDRVVGCGGVQAIGPGVAEIKRMWVDGSVRGRGLGARLLADLEGRARALGNDVVRLDTNGALVEAIALYRRAGYVEIARYNDNPYAEHFFEKPLVAGSADASAVSGAPAPPGSSP